MLSSKKVLGLWLVLTAGCATVSNPSGRVVLERSTRDKPAPDWVSSSKTIWSEKGQIYRVGRYQILSHHRINACFDLAKNDTKTNLINEIKEEFKGYLDISEVGLNNTFEGVFSKASSSVQNGVLQGLQFEEQYYERAIVAGEERVECFVLGVISNENYEKLKRSLMTKISETDPKLREKMIKKQSEFFGSGI